MSSSLEDDGMRRRRRRSDDDIARWILVEYRRESDVSS
jgi:hypothetical protein